MKVDIRITVGDKIIADSYGEPDDVFRQRRFPSAMIKQMQVEMMAKMAEAVERSITELYTRGVVQEPTSYPVRCGGGSPYDLKGVDSRPRHGKVSS